MPRRFLRVIDAIARQYPTLGDPNLLIRDGRVRADGRPIFNPHALVARDAAITIAPVVALRGTKKLGPALAELAVAVEGRVALDIGAAAGGFTRALLDAGARHVYAVDAGHGQLLGSLRQDPRVTNLERVNVGRLRLDQLPEPIDVVTIDVSYLPVARVVTDLDRLAPVLAPAVDLVALVKPTFELGRARPPEEPAVLARAVRHAALAMAHHGWRVERTIESPVRGRGGTIEFFVRACRDRAVSA